MTRMRKESESAGWRLLLAAAVWVLAAASANAHEQKTAVTRVLFNTSSGNLEVMHRLFLHDAEHAASVVFGAKQDIIQSADSRALFGSYVANRFALAGEAGAGAAERDEVDGRDGKRTPSAGVLEPLTLEYLGEELDGQYLWIYQEVSGFAARPSSDLSRLHIVNSILRDVWPDQANLVNVERDGRVASTSFACGADALSVALP